MLKRLFFSLLSKTISSLVANFACANLAAKFSAVNLLNSPAVIYLSEPWSSFFSILAFPVLYLAVLTKLLVSEVWIALTFLTNSSSHFK